ncbi:DNA/RNA non-specific endonuclease [Ekhidna sp.]|uniref:DNA/RNA non-specific endonuclease n=1 Tax=Ekhidna sp. TaxID=2608089 RepID=UPI0032EE81A5
MKKALLLVSILISILAYSQDSKYLPVSNLPLEIVSHSHYVLGYSEDYEQALWVAYELTSDELVARFERTDNFREDPEVSTGSASLSDYKGSGYDRGHLAPAADMSFSSTAMTESFYLSNMSPQVPGFNRGVWKRLEEQVRSWAESKGSIYVVTGSIISSSDLEIGVNGVEIPSQYYKVLLDEESQQAIGFVLKNESSSGELLSFAVTVDEVELLTSLDFFSQLDDSLEEAIESAYSSDTWQPVKFTKTTNYQNSTITSQQCKGIAKSTGVRCRNNTKNDSGYCYHHTDQAGSKDVEKVNQPASSGRCMATTKAGSQCKRNASSGSSYCWQHQ